MTKRLARAVGWLARVFALAGVLAVSTGGGCDWFNGPERANNPPEAKMESCPGNAAETIIEGNDVTIEWSGEDVEGPIAEYRWWRYLDGEAVAADTTDQTSHTVEAVARGEHLFEVWAVDGDGALSDDPAVCDFTVFASAEPGTLVGRVVLAEFVTGLSCPNCPDAMEGLEDLIDEYGADSLAVVAYHTQYHPLTTEEVLETVEAYFGTTLPSGLPAVFIDHAYDEPLLGATSPESAADRYRERIEERRALGSPLTIRATGGISAGEVTVTVRVENAVAGGSNVLRIMLVEDNVWVFNERNMFVVRDILEDEALTVAAVGDSAVIERNFAIDPGWDTGNMDVIAFVQDGSTLEVLQAFRLGTE